MNLDDFNVLQTENFFPKYLQKELLSISENVKYNFKPTISFEGKNNAWFRSWNTIRNVEETIGFSGFLEADDYQRITEIVKVYTEKKFNVTIKRFIRVMFVIIPPNPLYKDGFELTPHIDLDTSAPVKNLLYYVNDNDAPTIFYNQNVNYYDEIDKNNVSIYKKVFPKMGKASLWKGSILHAASVSKTNLRITLNILFE